MSSGTDPAALSSLRELVGPTPPTLVLETLLMHHRGDISAAANAYFDGGSGYVFETLCRANHSCAPNCAKAMSDRGGCRVVDVIALRAVPRGEEITVSYLKLDAPGAARRAYLREKYNFDCRCARCVLDGG